MIYTINNCIRAFGYTNFDNLIADMGSVDNLREYVRANGYADIAVAEDTELLLVDVNGKTWHTGCYGAVIEPPKPYLCFTSTGDSTVAMRQEGTPNTSANKVIQYKLNNGQWQTWDLSAVTLADGDKMYIKSDDEISMAESTNIYKMFVMTGYIAASGNVMSLIAFSDTLTDYGLCDLFKGCTSLTQAPELPATTLAYGCYSNMFYGCTSLTQAPALPATTLESSCYEGMFYNCTSLTIAPELPATTLEAFCYASMFKYCTSLTTTSALPATTLTSSCYAHMFEGCTSLVQSPELPATKLAEGCYLSMFSGCTSLVHAPELQANTLTKSCYAYMFEGCTSLTTAPAILPATTLAEECYRTMFYGCTSLTQAPVLPATTLATYCYSYMFKGCSALVQAPELPATELVDNCYLSMFFECKKLNYVKALFITDLSTGSYLGSWLSLISPTGTFVKNSAATWTNEQAGIPTGWTVQVEGGVTPGPEPARDYLCFTSTGNSTVAMIQEGTPNTSAGKVIQYKLNDGQWQTWDLSAVTLTDGDKMYIKSDDEIPVSEEYSIYKQFVMTGSIAASGNIMSLLNFSTTLTAYAFYYLFQGCTSLTQAPELPADTLATGCYNTMFHSTSITTAPALPATTLTAECYTSMFYNCASLTQAPVLPATTLADSCYYAMFSGCTSLTTAPELPATTLAISCYSFVFNNCSKLNYVKAMFTTNPATGSYITMWLGNVSPTGTFVKNSAATWTNDDAKIPTGWTVQVEGGVTPGPEPERDYLCFTSTGNSTVAMTEVNKLTDISKNKVIQYKINDGQWQTWNLSAVSLVDGDKMYLKSDDTMPISEGYTGFRRFDMTGSIAASGNVMSLLNFSDTLPSYVFYCLFEYCSVLTTAPALPATTLTEGCYYSMFSYCSSLIQAPALPATTLADHCYDAMFQECTSLTTAPELPATTLKASCYSYMFNGCTKLNYVKAMFTSVSVTIYSLNLWLENVSPTGTFVKNSAATWTNDDAGIPTGWTVQTASPDK